VPLIQEILLEEKITYTSAHSPPKALEDEKIKIEDETERKTIQRKIHNRMMKHPTSHEICSTYNILPVMRWW